MTDALDRAHRMMKDVAAASVVARSGVKASEVTSGGRTGSEATFRALTEDETARLEAQGCRCGDWSQVFVGPGFDPAHLRRTTFDGRVTIGRTGTPVQRSGGYVVPAGIRDSTVVDCHLGNDVLIDRVDFVSRTFIDDGALVISCAEITHDPGSGFGNGQTIQLACSPGGRPVVAVAEMPFDVADAMHGAPSRSVREPEASIHELAGRCSSQQAFIGRGARVVGTSRIHASWIGPAAVVERARTIEHSTLLSAPGRACRVADGAILRQALVQWNADISDGAIVQDSLVYEGATVTRQGIVMSSIIGPDCTIAEGEVTKSLVGPLVGFHHRALLVAARWPEGRGNVGQGANVGSNHTSRAPDQEIRCGEGTFFGLGVNIKMPADFSLAPYLLIATGVDTLPQRIDMPFALVSAQTRRFGSLSPAINEIRPGWMLAHNAYALARNELKFARRQARNPHPVDAEVFRPETIDRIVDALAGLETLSGRDWYTDRDLPGLGKNVMDEEARLEGIDAYRHALRRYAFGRIWRHFDGENGSERVGVAAVDPARTIPGDGLAHARGILALCSTETDPREIAPLYVAEERRWAGAVETSKRRDDERGPRIIPDYAASHPPASEDEVVLHVRSVLADLKERVRTRQRG